jgi:hypothetical protein
MVVSVAAQKLEEDLASINTCVGDLIRDSEAKVMAEKPRILASRW